MRTFRLHRLADPSGVSGVGDVAQGIVFDDGSVAMRWMTDTASTAVYGCLGDVLAIHGHSGLTRVRFDTPHDEDLAQSLQAALQVSKAVCVARGHEWDIADAFEAIMQVIGSRSFLPAGGQMALLPTGNFDPPSGVDAYST